ncbi:uncharacterized protein CANTADRAFT_26123 [Suhomyces tanzawaensis NRRL Y-17324]|uniref:Uncharacterized protein n=1 Tax=Suhomyces tanzawaensis NRRL Y-17324 TaxID=984487 RepID=A0A1E4SHR0_9ASCO|nr:uncharacterized protein CANTADRAFT_26123 [Suhomyces tanzawaensis NRRL Y-17324]ODV79049.1 hypothetical protein CANTADRAFT_26123 [Suhomyces tanzawaensis NRRL Y-17324]
MFRDCLSKFKFGKKKGEEPSVPVPEIPLTVEESLFGSLVEIPERKPVYWAFQKNRNPLKGELPKKLNAITRSLLLRSDKVLLKYKNTVYDGPSAYLYSLDGVDCIDSNFLPSVDDEQFPHVEIKRKGRGYKLKQSIKRKFRKAFPKNSKEDSGIKMENPLSLSYQISTTENMGTSGNASLFTSKSIFGFEFKKIKYSLGSFFVSTEGKPKSQKKVETKHGTPVKKLKHEFDDNSIGVDYILEGFDDASFEDIIKTRTRDELKRMDKVFEVVLDHLRKGLHENSVFYQKTYSQRK